MRRLIFVAVLLGASSAHAEDGDGTKRAVDKGTVGVGIILGEPTGISAKLYLKDDQAIQVAVGFAFYGGGFEVAGDYLFHPYILQSRDSFVLPFYIGPGLRLIQYSEGRDTSYIALGVRAVAGLLFDFKTVPLDAFVEIAGVLEHGGSGHGFDVKLNADVGIRYYF
jgi:hypothetical protein